MGGLSGRLTLAQALGTEVPPLAPHRRPAMRSGRARLEPKESCSVTVQIPACPDPRAREGGEVRQPWGQAKSLRRRGQIASRNSAPAAVTATLSAISSTGATSNSSQVENFAGASARLVGLSVSTTA